MTMIRSVVVSMQPPGPPLMSGHLGMPPFDGQSSMRQPDYHSESNDLFKIAHNCRNCSAERRDVSVFIRCRFQNGGRRNRRSDQSYTDAPSELSPKSMTIRCMLDVPNHYDTQSNLSLSNDNNTCA
jgi:hypothetical protein